MNILIQNKNGYSLTICSRSDSACLTEYPDFGDASADFSTVKIHGIPGEILQSSALSARDITIKFEARNVSDGLISKVFSPFSDVNCTINCKRQFTGRVKSTVKAERKHEIMPPVYTVQIRMFDPCFYNVDRINSVPFLNNGGTLFENGKYNYQVLSIFNDGDIACPICVNMKPTTKDSVAGLFTSAVWNNGSPDYVGYRLKNPTELGKNFYLSSDITDENAFSCYDSFQTFIPIILSPGSNTLYALNIEGTLEFSPAFLSIEEVL